MFADALRFFLLRDLSSRHFDYTASERRLMYLVVVVLTGIFSTLTDTSESAAKLQNALTSTLSAQPLAVGLSNTHLHAISLTVMAVFNIAVNLFAVKLLAWLIDSSVRTHRDWNSAVRMDSAVLCSAFIASVVLVFAQAVYLLAQSLTIPPLTALPALHKSHYLLLYAGFASLIGLWRVLRPIGRGRAAWTLARSYVTCVLIQLISLSALAFFWMWQFPHIKP